MLKTLTLFLLLSLSLEAYGICAQVLMNVQAPVVDGLGKYFLGAGEIYPAKGRNKDGTKLTLRVEQEIVAVDRDVVRLMKGGVCNLKKAPLPANIHKNAERPEPKEGPKEFVPIESIDELKPKLQEMAKPKEVEQKPPAPTAQSAKPEVEHSASPWKYGIEAGYAMNISSDGYSGLITAVPDPTNVGSLQDPIIIDVKEGAGYRLRGFMEKMLTPIFVSQVNLGYRQHTFSYVGKTNPTTAAVRLDQLSSFEKEFQANQIEVGGGLSYLQRERKWTFGYGVHLDLLYNLSGKKKIDVLVPSGPFFKNSPSSVEDGPETLEYQLKAKVDVRRNQYRFTLSVDQEASFSLSFGYLFN